MFDRLADAAEARGSVRVMIRLDAAPLLLDRDETSTWARDIDQSRGTLRAAQDQVLQVLGADFDEQRALLFETVPALAVTLEPIELQALQTAVQQGELPSVIQVAPDVRARKHGVGVPPGAVLDSSLVAIAAEAIHSQGAWGEGWRVAVVDDGVGEIAFLADKLVGGGRFTSHDPFTISGSTEPVTSAYGDASYGAPESGYGTSHGTGVAAIVCGNESATLPPTGLVGVAPGATVEALRVCGPLEGPWMSDVVDALEKLVVDHEASFRSGHPTLAAVNVSLGEGLFASQQECIDKASYGLEMWIACYNLLAIEIPVVASAGNDEKHDRMAAPAILNCVISVGATDDQGKALDLSNWSEHLLMGAPGSQLMGPYDSTLGARATLVRGTSGAAPHVAGAIALLRSAYPDRDAYDLLGALVYSKRLTVENETRQAVGMLDLASAVSLLEPESDTE